MNSDSSKSLSYHSYYAKFNNHPELASKIKEGKISVEFHESKKNDKNQNWKLNLKFYDEFNMDSTYYYLINEFEKYSLKTKIYEIAKDTLGIVSSTTSLYFNLNDRFPVLNISSDKKSDSIYIVQVNYMMKNKQ